MPVRCRGLSQLGRHGCRLLCRALSSPAVPGTAGRERAGTGQPGRAVLVGRAVPGQNGTVGCAGTVGTAPGGAGGVVWLGGAARHVSGVHAPLTLPPPLPAVALFQVVGCTMIGYMGWVLSTSVTVARFMSGELVSMEMVHFMRPEWPRFIVLIIMFPCIL